MAATGIDMLAFSGHKLYAPFGAGALVGRLAPGEPLLRGGGAIRFVSLDDVVWADARERYEAGSPNVIGVRNGCFCAHPLMAQLLTVPEATMTRLHAELAAGGSPELPGAVRASLGLGTTEEDVDALVAALHEVVAPAALRAAA